MMEVEAAEGENTFLKIKIKQVKLQKDTKVYSVS